MQIRWISKGLTVAATLALAGCSSIAGDPARTAIPFDTPYDIRGNMVAVCYSAQVSKPEQVAAAAAELCREPDTPVEILSDDLVFNGCPFFKKRRAVFACKYPKK